MIFKLILEDGLKYKEVAEILNISINTIDAQMAIAVKKICTALHIERPVRTHSAPPGKKESETFLTALSKSTSLLNQILDAQMPN